MNSKDIRRLDGECVGFALAWWGHRLGVIIIVRASVWCGRKRRRRWCVVEFGVGAGGECGEVWAGWVELMVVMCPARCGPEGLVVSAVRRRLGGGELAGGEPSAVGCESEGAGWW